MAYSMVNTCDICNVCNRKVQSFSYYIQCKNCLTKHHKACIILKRDELVSDMWYCPCCVQDIFVYNQLDDDDFYCAISEGISECGFRLHEIIKKVFIPFEINDSPNTPLFEIDPDIQYYMDMNYTENIRCNYYFEDVFNEKMKEVDKSSLSMFHLNVKSLPKHFDELELYLNSLDVKFSFLGLTETWLTECKQEYYDLPHYSCINKFRNDRKMWWRHT